VIKDFSFEPGVLVLSTGSRVTWKVPNGVEPEEHVIKSCWRARMLLIFQIRVLLCLISLLVGSFNPICQLSKAIS